MIIFYSSLFIMKDIFSFEIMNLMWENYTNYCGRIWSNAWHIGLCPSVNLIPQGLTPIPTEPVSQLLSHTNLMVQHTTRIPKFSIYLFCPWLMLVYYFYLFILTCLVYLFILTCLFWHVYFDMFILTCFMTLNSRFYSTKLIYFKKTHK